MKKRTIYSIFILLFVLLLGSCSGGRNIFFIIDTSGSMQEKELMQDVKHSVKKILLDYQSGDKIQIIRFDSDIQFLYSKKIENNKDLQTIFDSIDSLQAKGQWTNLIQVLNFSLEKVVEIQKLEPDSKTILVLYTDGKNDPSPDIKDTFKMNFSDLFNKYFKDKLLKKSWFMYYVELDQPEPELAAFLNNSGDAGIVITKKAFDSNINFTVPKSYDYRLIALLLFFIFILIFTMYLFHPWFKRISLVPVAESASNSEKLSAINLNSFRKRFFSNFLVIGSKGDIKINDTNASEKQLALGVNYSGSYYIKPLSKDIVKVDNKILTDKQVIKPGQVIQIGHKKFIFEKISKE